ncbi:MAG TPA: Rieske (2Fe-2S) protein, partial [Aggregatilineales bacterium]|nr:Rieske (2Fe-2S) protein [Aggregatilineales bacterium]
RFLSSRQAAATVGQIVTAGIVTDFQPGTVTPFDAARFFLVRFADGGFLALHSKCTHLACIVGWDKQAGQFACPCHGSIFDQQGTVLHSPAPRPLDRYAIVIDSDGRLKVDTSVPIARSAASLGERVYP